MIEELCYGNGTFEIMRLRLMLILITFIDFDIDKLVGIIKTRQSKPAPAALLYLPFLNFKSISTQFLNRTLSHYFSLIFLLSRPDQKLLHPQHCQLQRSRNIPVFSPAILQGTLA